MKRPGVRRLFSLSLRRRRWESEVEEEILNHLTIRAERLVALGLTPQAARDEAIRRFGPLEESRRQMMDAAAHRESYMRRKEAFTEFRQDISFAARTLMRNKGWAAVAIVTLALGIGATTAVWSAASSVLLHPLTYPDADRVVNVNLLPGAGNSTGVDVVVSADVRLVRAWRAESRSFEAIEPYSMSGMALGTGGDAEDVVTATILPSFVAFTGQRPLMGRVFNWAEARSGGVAMLAENFWRTRFGADPAILGRTLMLGGRSVVVIGVMPAAMMPPRLGGRPTAVWLPLDLSRDSLSYRAVGRLRPGVDPAIAQRELDSIAVRSGVFEAKVLPFRAAITAPGQTVSFRESLLMLAGAVMLVLLVAAANVAHLLMARAIARQREVAIRTSLGASRGRLVRQMATETLVLTAVGCALGAALGYLALAAMVKMRPPTLSELQLARIDWPAMALVIGASLVCALVFTLVAAGGTAMRESSLVLRGATLSAVSRAGERLRSSLVITEMALSAMLLVGAVLLMRTVIELQQMELGFDPKNLHVIVPSLPEATYTTPQARLAAVRQVAAAVRAVPGVDDVAVTDALPSYRNFSVGTLEIQGQRRPTERTTSFIDVGRITPAYFRVLRAQLVEGRLPDSTISTEIAINEGYARKQWRDGGALGKRVRVFYESEENPWLTIVGVVRDISTMGPVGDKAAPFLYTSLSETDNPGIIYRTDGKDATVAQALAISKSTLPGVRFRQHVTEKIIADTLAPSRFIMLLMTGFTALAVILAAIGLYGMMAYAVAQRTREIGIRIALGATRRRIARAVVGRAALMGLTGAAIGLLLAMWGTRAIEGTLYGVSRLDATSFAIGGVCLVAIAVIASLVPMRRAVAVDPMTAIRAD
jgi:putative ABC transport system permease protein